MKRIVLILLVVVFGLIYGQAEEQQIESVENKTESRVPVQVDKNKIVFNNDINFIRDTHEEDIKNILKAIAKENGSQISIDESVKGTLTHTFSMPLEGAWNMIIEKFGLNYKVIDNVIMVDALKLEKKILVLKYLNAHKLKALLDNYDIIDKSVNRLEFGKGMDNTVFIEGKAEVIKELEDLIGQLEKAEELKQAKREKIQKEIRENKRLELEQNNAMLKRLREEQELEQKEIMFNNRMAELNRQMIIDVIPLKYINVSKSEMEFQGQKIQLESLEDTLKGLLGTNFADRNSTKGYVSETETAFLRVDQRTNSVIIKDLPSRVAEIRKILKDPVIGLDKPPMLVEIEVTIAMGNSGFTEELGMKLGGTRRDGKAVYGLSSSDNVAQNLNELRRTATTQITTTSNGAVSNSETEAINSSFQNVNLLQPVGALGLSSSMLFVGGKTMLNFQLNAMENEGLGKVLSNPRIITMNNREATILSGNSVSIPIATADKMGLQTVDTGISIKTKPHVVLANSESIKDCEILLDISIEKSSLGTVSREKIETAESKVNSNVMIKNGQTLILGGLFQYTKNDSTGGIPLLKDIPLLGFLFQTKNSALHKNELLFFITPRVITTSMVDKMQDHSYMSYKKNLEFHKENLTQKLNEADNTEVEKEKEEKTKKVETVKEEREFTHEELLAGKGEEEEW